MTTDELIDACLIARDAGEEVLLNPNQILDLLNVVATQDGQIDATFRAIGIDPQDAPTAMDLAKEVRKRIVQAERAAEAAKDLVRAALKMSGGDALAEAHQRGREMGRKEGRDEALLAALEPIQNLPHEGAAHLSVLIQNAIRELK